MRDYIAFILQNSRLLAFGMLLCLASSFGQTFFISLFSAEIRADYGLSAGEFGAVYSIGTLLSAGALLWTGQLIDRIDLRLYVAGIIAGLALAGTLMMLSAHVALLVLAVFLLRQCGQGLPGHAAMTTMGRYFETGRGKALSIAGLGWPLGESVLPLITVAAVAAVGWRGSWGMITAFLLLGILPALLLLLRGHGARHSEYLTRLEAEERAAETAQGPGAGLSWTRAQVLRDPRFYLILPGLMGPGFIFTGLFFHQILIMVEIQGWSKTALASSYPVYAMSTVAASLATGILCDRFGPRSVLTWFLLPQIAAVLILISGDAAWILLPYMVLTGLSTGMTHTLVSALWPDLYGRRHLGAIRAMTTAIAVFATAASPVLLGYLFDLGASLTAIGIGLTAYALFGLVLCNVAVRMPERRPVAAAL